MAKKTLWDRLVTECPMCRGSGTIRELTVAGEPIPELPDMPSGPTYVSTCKECGGKGIIPSEMGEDLIEFFEAFMEFEFVPYDGDDGDAG